MFAFLKGSVFPDTMGVSLSIDGLVMVLLGGVETVVGPVVGALLYKLLSIWLISQHRLFQARARACIIGLVLVFPRASRAPFLGGVRAETWRRAKGRAREGGDMSALLEVRDLAKAYGGVQRGGRRLALCFAGARSWPSSAQTARGKAPASTC